MCSHVQVVAKQQPLDEQTNWPQTWWGAGWDIALCGVCCPPVVEDLHGSNASPSHCSTGTESWTRTPTHWLDRRRPQMNSGWQKEAYLSHSDCCRGKLIYVKVIFIHQKEQSEQWVAEESRDSQGRQKNGFFRGAGQMRECKSPLSHQGILGCISPRHCRARFNLDMSYRQWSCS